MLQLHPLEERIVLDAALLIELEDERRGAQEGESGSVPDPDAVDEPGEASWSEAGEDRSMPVMAALQLLDSASLHPVAESLPAPLLYREGDGDQRVLEPEQLPVLEADQGHATWATVTLEGASVGDELVAPDSDADFDIRSEGAHEVTITASASLLADNTPAEVEELLRNKVALINYTNSAPDPLEGVRSLHFTLGNDMHQASLLRFVSVTSANDAPILTAGGPTELDFTEPADPGERVPLSLFGPGTVSITDVDSALVGGASVWISDAPASASDPLGSLDRLLVELPADGSITARLSFTPVADRSLGELRLTLEGAASAETYARVLESVRFDSLDTDPLQTSRTLRVNVSDIDDDGAREDAVSRSIERRIAIEPTNTAPTVILENVLFSEQSDRLANVPLFPRLELLDPDSDDLLTRVVVTLDNAGRHIGDSINAYLSGNALFSVTRVTDGARDTYTIQPRAPGSTATVGQFEAFLSSWTYGNSSRANVDHSIDITVRAFDAQGAVGEESSTLTIAAHPDAPTSEALPRPGSPGALTVAEDGRLGLPAELFPFRDADGDKLGGVTITTLPAHGSLLIDGVAVQAGQLIPAAALANLVYAP
ncbi:hypothetical protein, partial [Thauera phenylacetica]|uniref:hypothetical protein n=1 Tax=Thauera phenylacetica TaxID=164400 RepID=UPI0039E2C72C